jgi:hypothetical protein
MDSLKSKLKAKKNLILGIAMIIFAVAYPVSYICAGTGALPLIIIALVLIGAGCILASVI